MNMDEYWARVLRDPVAYWLLAPSMISAVLLLISLVGWYVA